MTHFTKLSTLLLLLIISMFGNQLNAQEQIYSKDVASIDNIVNAALESISGDKGVERNWERFRNLFLPTAQINAVFHKNDSSWIKIHTITEFVDVAGTWYEDNGFREYKYKNHIDTFGNIAHVFQSYGATLADGVEIDRGINSFQLVYDKERWWIVNLIWDSETEKVKIPKDYL